MTRKRINVAASVLAQAKARAARAPQNIISFPVDAAPTEREPSINVLHSWIYEAFDPETGAPRLLVIFPAKKKPEKYDLTRLLVQPEIARFLAQGFRHWGSTVDVGTRIHASSLLNAQIGNFLATFKTPQSLADIDEAFWASFIHWVNGPRKRDGQPWAEQTRSKIQGVFGNCIAALLDHREWGAVADHLMNRSGFPRNPWPGRTTKQIPTEVMSPPERQAMIFACLGEIAALRQRLDEREITLEQGLNLLEEARKKGRAPPYRQEIGVCAARIAEAFPDRLASLHDLKVIDPSLELAVRTQHGMLAVRRLLYATFRDLVPFVLLIGVKSAFNPDTILSLTWSRVRVSEDGQTVTFLGVKGRSTDLQVGISPRDYPASDFEVLGEPAELLGLSNILELLRRLTRRTRALLANPDHADNLFIAVPVQTGTKARAFEHRKGRSVDISWKYWLTDFIEVHDLMPFTLVTLRFTEGEMEWWRTGDLLAVRDRLGHQSVATTRTHYTSAGMRRESQERVAETQALHHRWSHSEGRIDPRTQPEQWRSAATPGFECMNPYDSPRPGQRKNRLCDAYGECPGCPMAKAWPQDVQAAAYYMALPKAIHEARLGRISAQHWVEKWPPILRDLNKLLAEIPPEVQAAASKFSIKLKPVG